MTEPILTALVSTYASERYLRGCLDSLLAQTLGERVQIVVIDACSPQGEAAIVREYQQRHRNIDYVRTPERVFTSEAFDIGTRLAKGRYLTTANTDDRHRPDFAARMCGVLDAHPQLGIVYADSLITHRDNETWQDNTAVNKYAWPDYTATTALSCCLFGAQPVWRKAAHDVVGAWDPAYVYANDQDMFLRIALRFGAVHLRAAMGMFLMRKDSNSGADNRDPTLQDVLRVMRHYRTHTPLEVLFPALTSNPDDASGRAAAWIELGNLCALGPYTDAELALDCYRRAVQVPLPEAAAGPVRLAFANNSGCVLAAAGARNQAERALALCGEDAHARANRRTIAGLAVVGLRQLQFVQVDHPVVAASRTTRALELDPDGGTRWAATTSAAPWEVFDGPNGAPLDAGDKTWSFPVPPRRAQRVMVVMYGWADSGGGTMLPRAFTKALAARGHEVAVFYAAARPEPALGDYAVRRHTEDGVRLFGLCNRASTFMDLDAPGREIDDPQARSAFAAVLDEVSPHVVHFWNLHNLGMSLPGECRARGVPTVLSSNNYWALCPRLYLISEQLQRCEGGSEDGRKCERCLGTQGLAADYAERLRQGQRMLREDIDVHLAVSTRVRDLYVQNGDDPGHVRVLRQEPEALTEIWRRTGSARPVVSNLQRPLRVGFVGSVMAHKGVHVLAQALQLLPAGSVEAVALGDVATDYLPALRHLDPEGRLHLFGRYDQKRLPELLAALDVVVVPSVWDDCAPFVVAEALAARCPVIGSRAGGIPDFVQHGHNGLLFELGDATDLARCLQAFGDDPDLLGRLQAGIDAPRGLEAFVDDVLAVYREVLVTSGAASARR